MKHAIANVWLKDSVEPIEAGELHWEDSGSIPVGSFRYSAGYLKHPYRFALDPVNLPLSRGEFRTILSKGIFGVMRDSGPDSWGRGLLQEQYGELDDFDYLTRSMGDGVGAITLGEMDQKLYSLSDLDKAFKVSSKALFENKVKINIDDENRIPFYLTSLGGAKPKLTIEHSGELWIAKFPETRDSYYLPHNEHCMLKLAAEVGISAAESFVYKLSDGRSILVIKRFDRYSVTNGYARVPYASAHTVVGLGESANTDGDKKSYLRLADSSRRWAGKSFESTAKALWERAVFNALVGNSDDHARNHGFLFAREKGNWELSPAFDITAIPYAHTCNLSMMILRDGAFVSKDRLILFAEQLGLNKDEAISRITAMAYTVRSRWEDILTNAGASEDYIQYLRPAFRLASHISSTT